MKSTLYMTAFSGLLVMFAAATPGQAANSSVSSLTQEPVLMLAEGGSNRLLQYQVQRLEARRDSPDASQGFAQLIEEQPTAAGMQTERAEGDTVMQPDRQYKSPIHRDRVEFGLH
ncbi:hypothetical protein FBY03_12367 [Pseudomonas sp. SJZ079]|uniref:hypothetical protein n=1 Tax=Pseudomonas sp. SJZ079 TaxID=2572887 RepID=UPI00119B02F2|nr:hypothetical protein [Pseudomonas sp. SJZ079]TWC30577.1 hypothetical protein FBY03_12367 [Pseudomonas sp. SJZ079]